MRSNKFLIRLPILVLLASCLLTPITPLFAPSQRPEEPITTGVDIGAGAGSETLMLNQMSQQQSLSQTLAEMLPYDTNGEIAALYEQALSRGL